MKYEGKESLLTLIEAGNWGAIHSLLIWKDDSLMLEAYFDTFEADDLHEAQSVTKSLQSLLVGMAWDQNLITSIDTSIYPYFSDYHYLDWSQGKDQITLRHLLTMCSGLTWRESQVSYLDLTHNYSNWMNRQLDWIHFALDQPMEYAPGQYFEYSSAAPILISYLLRAISGMSNEEFALRYLFEPLEIEAYAYQRNIYDSEILADIELKPRDLLKIGQLMLQEGEWQGKRLISSSWIQMATRPQVSLENYPYASAYGFFWWVRRFRVQEQLFEGYYAWGYGGQHIFVLPSLRLVVVFTGRNYEVNLASEPFDILENYILKENI